MTYRAVLHGTTSASSSKILRHIEQWTSEGVTISIQNILINLDPSCVLVIDSISDNECEETDQPNSNNIGVAAAIGSTVVAVVILSLSIAVTIVAVSLFKWRRNFIRTRTDEKRYTFL